MEKVLPAPLIHQSTETDCGVAVAAMALSLKLKRTDVDLKALVLGAIAALNNTRSRWTPRPKIDINAGIHPKDMGDIFAQLGINTAYFTYPLGHLSFDDVEKYIKGGSPVLSYIQLGLESEFGHYVLIVGYGKEERNGDKQYLVLHDPKEQLAKYVYYDNFPSSYYNEAAWGWYESWVLSWVS